ncbi:MAG: DUF4159 domain-containing protein [Pyrinomonadaceae bacterium]
MNRRKFVSTSMTTIASTVALASAGNLFAADTNIINSPSTNPHLTGSVSHSVSTGEYSFTRLRYSSGNWDADPKMPSNLLNSLVEYTSIRVDTDEKIVEAASSAIMDHPFLYLTGNKLVRFSASEKRNLRQYLRRGGFLFVDDCNHDVDGTFAKTFEAEVGSILDRPEERLRKISNTHPIYNSFFSFPDGPPQTSHELNGWGDDVVHDYLQAAEIDGRIAVLYSNKDYGCEWNYDWTNKRFSTVDNTRFGVNIIVYALTH